MKIQPVKRITVTEQVMEQIAGLITGGHLPPGSQLPTERELAVQLGVTRGRVREALRALSLIGLITIKAGEGSFVNAQKAPIPADTILWMFHQERHNLDEVYAARKLIETEVYHTASGQLTEHDLNELDRIMRTAAASLHLEADRFLELLDRFDLYVGNRCGNHLYAKLMQTIVHLRRETSTRLLQVPGAKESSIESRSSILAALRSRNESQVKRAVRQFFTSSRKFYERLMK